MIEIMFLLVPFYGVVWFSTLLVLIARNRMVNRVFQYLHTFYLILFVLLYYYRGGDFIPFHLFLFLQLVSASYFAYRYVRFGVLVTQENEQVSLGQQLTPEGRQYAKKFKKTVDQLFNNTHQNQ